MLMLAPHVRPSQIAVRLAISRNHVHYWVRRYIALGVVVRDASRPGRKKRLSPERVAAIVTTTPPGRTHWSTRSMARAGRCDRGTGQSSSCRVRPARTEDHAIEQPPSRIQARRPVADVVVGLALGQPRAQRQHGPRAVQPQATPADQAIHVILDNLSTHTSPPVQRWLRRHPRVHFHFIPTSSCWLNLVERWFGEIARDRIRRGTFNSVPALVAAIDEYLKHYNEAPQRFIWTKNADMIFDTIARCPRPLTA
jgi:transposase